MAQSTKRRSIRPAKASRKHGSRPAISKLDQIVRALRTPKGATLGDLMDLTGWQLHSVRGAIAGALKRKRGLTVISEKHDGERIYRIVGKAAS